MISRRQFALSAAATAMAAAPSDRIQLAVIGVRGQGRSLAARFATLPNCQVRTLCDVDPRVYARAANEVEKASGVRPPLVSDLRRVLDDRSIDAVVIATPDHWHCPATLLACAAGKDVYVEKPASHNLREGRWMVDAARRHQRIVQLGTQSRSRPSTRRAIEIARSGKLGKVLLAKAWNTQMRENIGRKPDSTPPKEVDYDTWIGPAPALPFSENRFHYQWHWHWNYGTGDMGNDGVHQLDIARWALGVEAPTKVTGSAAKLFFVGDDQQTPDTMNINFEFLSGQMLMFEMRDWNPYGLEGQENGVAVYGSDGYLHIGRWANGKWGHRLYDTKGKLVEDRSSNDDDNDRPHLRNFLDCIKSRQAPNADIETGHRSSTLCHLGNIVARTGRAQSFDPAKEAIAADSEASQLLGRRYRSHWATPKSSS